MKIKKILLLTIDSLRYDRLGSAGYPMKLTPTLDFLAEKGIHCTQAVAHASCTQMSSPSIWTSTLPFDFGGYDRGITQRPVTLAEVCQENGFKTVAFPASFYLGHYYGYDRGFDELYPLYTIGEIWSAFRSSYLKYYLSYWRDGNFTNDRFFCTIQLLLEDALNSILNFCQQTETSMHTNQHINHPAIHRKDLQQIQKNASLHLKALRQEPKTYMLKHALDLEGTDLNSYLGLQKTVADQLAYLLYSIMPSKLSLDHIAQRYFISKGLLDFDLVNGSYTLEVVQNWIERHKNDSFFLSMSLDDIHSGRFSPGDFQNPLRWPRVLAKRFQLGSKYRSRLTYDLSVRYVDFLVERIIKTLAKNEMLDETLLVICSDHGSLYPLNENSARPDKNYIDFYEEKIRVPLIFWNRNLTPQKIDHLIGLIDLAPTLVDLMGWPSQSAFKGYPVYSAETKMREYLIAEDADSGPCDLANKALRIAVRTPEYKYIWQEARGEKEERNELYDIKKDPEEKYNLANVLGHEMLHQKFKSIAQQRWRKIKTD